MTNLSKPKKKKNLFTQTYLTVLKTKKLCISKLSIKMFIIKKTKAGKAYQKAVLTEYL